MKLSTTLLILLFLNSGCGRGDRTQTAQVSGLVTLDGKPVTEGLVMFEKPGSRTASGQIRNGAIVEVMTYLPNDGVPVGRHRVAVFVNRSERNALSNDPGQVGKFDPNYMGGESLIPARYNDPATSNLTADVPAEGLPNLKLDISSK